MEGGQGPLGIEYRFEWSEESLLTKYKGEQGNVMESGPMLLALFFYRSDNVFLVLWFQR